LAGFAEEVQGAEQGAGAGGVCASEAFSAGGIVEGEAVGFSGFFGLLAGLVVGGEMLESFGFASDHGLEPVLGGLLFGWVEGLQAAGGEAGFIDEFLAGP